jgi:Cation/multidrug efflux pump
MRYQRTSPTGSPTIFRTIRPNLSKSPSKKWSRPWRKRWYLVILVVYLFLQSWRATLIPGVAVPVSLIGTFAGMQALGFSINTLTLFGMVLAIGMVVDDAIVVVENVERHMGEGLSPKGCRKEGDG